MSQPVPVETPPVEAKVKVATAGSYVGGVLALFVLQLLSDSSFIDTYSSYLPPTVTTFVLPLLPAFVTFATAYITKHTARASGLGTVIDDQLRTGIEAAVRDSIERYRPDATTQTIHTAERPDEFDAAAHGK